VSIAAIQGFLPSRWSLIVRWPDWLLAAGLSILVSASLLTADRASFGAAVFGFPLISIGYGLVLVAAVSPSSALHRIDLKVTSWLASISYSLYLIHKGAVHLLQTFLSDWGIAPQSTVVFLASIAFSCLAAWMLYLSVERPFMKLRSVVLVRREKERALHPVSCASAGFLAK